MIKIKDYIFNGNNIIQIDKCCGGLTIQVENGSIHIEDATFEDIEWNYGTPQETQRQIQKELCKSCYYRDTISNKIKELEEENKRLKISYNTIVQDNVYTLELEQKIKKAIEYIKELFILEDDNVTYEFKNDEIKPLLEILKGEENDR